MRKNDCASAVKHQPKREETIPDKLTHKGHRQRAKETMLAAGIDNMHEYHVLEILLFYAIPKIDTNPIAHRLIDRFGSLKGVLDADYSQLLEVKGIGENAASMIKFTQMFSRRYLMSTTLADSGNSFEKVECACEFCCGIFLGEQSEKVYAIALDNGMGYIKHKQIGTGTVSGVDMNLRLIIDFVVKSECSYFLLTHNHPKGSCLPSKNDMMATTQLLRALKPIGIIMVDHIIVGLDGFVSMKNSGYCTEIWNE